MRNQSANPPFAPAAIALFVFALCAAAVAQDVVSGADDAQQVINVFQPAPSDVRRPLMRADKAIEQGRDADAAYELGMLLASQSLDEAEQQDYFLFDPDHAGALGTDCLKAEVNRRIASLSPAGRQAYELQFGAQARALLEEALTEMNMDKLSDVIRRFLHTEAGHEACMLAGRLELGRGRPTAAALQFSRIINSDQALAKFDPELSILLATCWLYANIPEKANETLIALKRRSPGAIIRVGDRDERLFDNENDALPWLQNLIGSRPSLLADQAIQWVVHRGNGQRNARVEGSLPMMRFRWRVPTPILRTDEEIIKSLDEQYRDEGLAAIPVMQPLAVGNTILMRTPDKLLGVDFLSGKRVWLWPPWDDEVPVSHAPTISVNGQVIGPANREQQLHQRLWEDAAHGQLSSDGKSVFLLHQLGFAASGRSMPNPIIIMQGGLRVVSSGTSRSTNQLVCLSLERQGAARWIVGGEQGEDEPRLAGAFFLGAPLPLGGKLYTLAEFLGEIRLVVLDAETGRLEWQQQLAHVDQRTIVRDSLRRLSGASPSYEGGVLVCPTGAGAMVAVDVATHALLWGYQYLEIPQEMQRRGFGMMSIYRQKPIPRVGERWADATVTVADGRVLLTAVESDDLHCLDLLTGKLAWPPQPRGQRLYVACVHDGKAIFVGVNQVTAIRLSDGKPAWESAIELDDPPSGRGFYSGHFFYLPTTGAELVKIDLDRGIITSTAKTTTVLGNLICYRGDVISQSPLWVTSSFQSEPLQSRVEHALAQNPNDVDALCQFGEIQRQEGKLQEAIATLRKALSLQPENETARTLLVDTMIVALESDFAANHNLAPEIEQLADRPAQRREFLKIMARGWHQLGDLPAAFQAYVSLADLNAKLELSRGIGPERPDAIERYWHARIDRWLQGRVGELLSGATDAQHAQMAEVIHQRYESALNAETTDRMQRFLRYFGIDSSANEIRLRLAERWVKAGVWLKAELLLKRLLDSQPKEMHGPVIGQLATLMEMSRQFDQALDYYQQLRDLWPNATCCDGKTGQQLYEEFVSQPEAQQVIESRMPWPVGTAEIVERSEQVNRFPSYRRIYPIAIRQASGAVPEGLGISLDQHLNAIAISDARGKPLANISLGQQRPWSYGNFGLTRVHLNGHLAVLYIGAEVLAMDLLRAFSSPSEAILWRKALNHVVASQAAPQPRLKSIEMKNPWGGKRYRYVDTNQRSPASLGPVLDSGVYLMSGRELSCVDPLTGITIWSRDNLPPGSEVFGDEHYIFAVPPEATTALVFNALDGTLLGERELELAENRWATHGANVLAWTQNPQNGILDLKLYNAWTGDELWHEQFPPGAKGTLVGCDEVAVMDPNGKFLLRSLRDPKRVVEAKLEAEEQLSTLHVLRSRDQYLVAANRVFSPEPNTPEAQIRSIISGTATQLITGNIYALDRQTGEMQWDEPAKVKQFGFPENQPIDSPVLVFLRHIMPKGTRTSTSQHTSVLCIDRRDGHVVLQKDDIPAQTYTYEILADRTSGTVTLSLPQRTLELHLTDKPAE